MTFSKKYDIIIFIKQSAIKERLSMKVRRLISDLRTCDYVIDVRQKHELRILQLTDMQIIDLDSTRNPTRDRQIKGAYFKEGVPSMDERCFVYVQELIERTSPDLILMTGDNVYGEFDDNCRMLRLLCERMEEYGVYWAPVFGNHDNESRIGVREQIRIMTSYSKCLFCDNGVTGHSNYNILIRSDERDVLGIFMLDSNGCKNVGNPWAPEEGVTPDNIDYDLLEHRQGIYPDQVEWFKKRAYAINAENGKRIPSIVCFHIPSKIFDKAFCEKYGYVYKQDFIADKDGDMGRIVEHGNHSGVDDDLSFHKIAKDSGAIAYLVGHEHNNNACIKYDGIYLNYGVKTGVCTYYKDDSIGGTLITVPLSTPTEIKFEHVLCENRLKNNL